MVVTFYTSSLMVVRNSCLLHCLRCSSASFPKLKLSSHGVMFQVDQFRADIIAASFHVAQVFEEKDDVLWAWKKLFKNICDLHAPMKRAKIRSQSSPSINNEIRRKMNLKFKLFKDGAYYCYCAYVLRISRYSDFLSVMLTNTGIFLRGLKLSGESTS